MPCKICNTLETKNTGVAFYCKQQDGMVHASCCQNSCNYEHVSCIYRTAIFRHASE